MYALTGTRAALVPNERRPLTLGEGAIRSPAGYFFGPCLTERTHRPWFWKPNCLQPPCLHCCFAVGACATGLTATSVGRLPAAIVAALSGESAPLVSRAAPTYPMPLR
jgi:hypothetical protein